MRKLLLALLVAGMLGGAVYGAAASFVLTTPDLGSDEAVVAACGDAFSVAYTTAFDGPPDNRYEVTFVTVTEIAGVDLAITCDGTALASFQLTDVANAALAGASGGPAALGGAIAVGTPPDVADVFDIAVVVTGG
jgi:hypothetical protein